MRGDGTGRVSVFCLGVGWDGVEWGMWVFFVLVFIHSSCSILAYISRPNMSFYFPFLLSHHEMRDKVGGSFIFLCFHTWIFSKALTIFFTPLLFFRWSCSLFHWFPDCLSWFYLVTHPLSFFNSIVQVNFFWKIDSCFSYQHWS